ncbi:putative uncharacterized protein DDB_G0286901 [Octopus sinensis]|uniref:Uncharacterized protein n=1 Tax=Octopus sinensis TaxID=2607531 RepID=A0A6P7TYN5_9MOLL|nr:putative uncharacterized protein DDB_G0286901 [Octopus sinensis]
MSCLIAKHNNIKIRTATLRVNNNDHSNPNSPGVNIGSSQTNNNSQSITPITSIPNRQADNLEINNSSSLNSEFNVDNDYSHINNSNSQYNNNNNLDSNSNIETASNNTHYNNGDNLIPNNYITNEDNTITTFNVITQSTSNNNYEFNYTNCNSNITSNNRNVEDRSNIGTRSRRNIGRNNLNSTNSDNSSNNGENISGASIYHNSNLDNNHTEIICPQINNRQPGNGNSDAIVWMQQPVL